MNAPIDTPRTRISYFRRTAPALRGAAMCALIALAACGESTQSVGHLKAASTSAGNPGGSAPSSAQLPPWAVGVTVTDGGPPTQNASGSSSSDSGGSSVVSVDGGPMIIQGGKPDPGEVPVIVPPVCTGAATAAERRRLDIVLVVDNQISIPTAAWSSLLRGLKRFVADPRADNTGVGVAFLGFACDQNAYDNPTVGVDVLSRNRAKINAAIDLTLPFNLSPLRAAIEGTLVYGRSLSNTYPERKVALVLVTDSIMDVVNCGDADSLSAAARAGFASSPSIPSYVLAVVDPTTFKLTLSFPAVTNPMLKSSPIGPLNQIAAAGGTSQAYPYEVLSEPQNTNSPSPFAETMLKIQHDAEPCDFVVPDAVPDDAKGTWLLLGGSTTPMPHLNSEADCGDGYSFTTTADGTRWAHLCSNTCADLKNVGGALSWVGGCP